MNKRYSDPHQMPYESRIVDLEAILEIQVKANLALIKMLSEKDKLIHSLAHDLIAASECIDYVGSYYTTENKLNGMLKKYKVIAQSALDSITDKGEKDE